MELLPSPIPRTSGGHTRRASRLASLLVAAAVIPFWPHLAAAQPTSMAGEIAGGASDTTAEAIADDAAVQDEEPQDSPRWAGSTELTLTDASGNQRLTVFTTGFKLRHLRTEIYAFELEVQGRYGSSDGEQVAESYKGGITFDFTPQSRWSPFLHTEAEHDPFRRLDVRMNSGAGARFRVYREPSRGEVDLSVAMMHSYEAFAHESDGTQRNRARWNIRANGSRRVHEGVTLSHRTRYQPIVGETGDYLLTMETGLRVHLSRRIALSVSHEYNRDSTPPEDVHADDRLLKAGVQVDL